MFPTIAARRFALSNVVALLSGLAAAVVYNVIFPPSTVRAAEMRAIFILLGAGFGVVSAGATWFALGPFPMVVRMPLALLLVVLAWGGMAGGFAAIDRLAGELLVGLVAGVAGQFVVIQFPLWFLRGLHGLRIAELASLPDNRDRQLQFSLGQMLLIMAIIGVILALLRMCIAWATRLAGNDGGAPEKAILVFVMIAGFDLLLAWPAIWAFLSPGRYYFRMPLAIVLAVGVTLVQYPIFEKVLGPGPSPYVIVWLNAPQCLMLMSLFLATRWAGFALVRNPP